MLLSLLHEWRLLVSLALFALLLVSGTQAPLNYQLDIGREEGPGSDLPLVAGMYPPEQYPNGLFRWTMGRAVLALPGVGGRSLLLRLQILPLNEEMARLGPSTIHLWSAGRLLGQMQVHPHGGSYNLLLPPATTGDQIIELHSTTVVPTGDKRALAIPLDTVSIYGPAGPITPPWRSTNIWLCAAVLLWLIFRRSGIGAALAQQLLSAVILLVSVAALLDPVRCAFGALPALISLALGFMLVMLVCAETHALLLTGCMLALLTIAGGSSGIQPAHISFWLTSAIAFLLAGSLRPPLVRLYRTYTPPIAPMARRWLLLIAVLTFVLRFGGKLYPASMHGDINFHANRYEIDLIHGTILAVSNNRGVDFPYPPAFYVLLAPFTLLGMDIRTQLWLVAAALDAISPLLVYLIAACAVVTMQRYWAVLAGGIYSFTAAGFMATWWNFSTHIFTAFAHLLLVSGLVLGLPRLQTMTRSARRVFTGLLIILQVFVYLGHFGFWLNTSLLMGIMLLALGWAWLRGKVNWLEVSTLASSTIFAQLFVVLFFYSAYTSMFASQVQTTAVTGLSGLAAGEAPDYRVLAQTLWQAGLQTHFGFFPIPLALCGLALLRRRSNVPGHLPHLTPTAVMLILAAGTVMIASSFAVLPFLTSSVLSTRWLMFSAWMIAASSVICIRRYWRSGPAGRLVGLAMAGYIVWITASLWLAALAWRIRPPEPF